MKTRRAAHQHGHDRYVRNEATLKRGIPNVAAGTATLAAISQGLSPNYDETIKPNEKDQWVKFAPRFPGFGPESQRRRTRL